MDEPVRLFTLQEAKELIPWLQETFDSIKPLEDQRARAEARVRSLMTRIQSNGGASSEEELEKATRTINETQGRIDKVAHAIVERGIIVRSTEQGLVDFPSLRDGRTTYLCWLAGETSITNWHETDEGFAARQPL